MSSTIKNRPVGWWFSFDGEQWTGPFASEEVAVEEVRILLFYCSSDYINVSFLYVAPWDEKIIKVQRH
jgi:hypothetical protein